MSTLITFIGMTAMNVVHFVGRLLKNVPEGYEDKGGFHYGKMPPR